MAPRELGILLELLAIENERWTLEDRAKAANDALDPGSLRWWRHAEALLSKLLGTAPGSATTDVVWKFSSGYGLESVTGAKALIDMALAVPNFDVADHLATLDEAIRAMELRNTRNVLSAALDHGLPVSPAELTDRVAASADTINGYLYSLFTGRLLQIIGPGPHGGASYGPGDLWDEAEPLRALLASHTRREQDRDE
ncbi:MAG TPA: hypothetical protein VKR30_00565 [Candidatus Limnocylindrales bacterium]|nr:hypothetical protein [Candidatus Limnocylindrales bacterium]